jgi:hypothetical protein
LSWVELIDINLVDNLLIDVALIATLILTHALNGELRLVGQAYPPLFLRRAKVIQGWKQRTNQAMKRPLCD